jgi:PAS domain-containing protein
VLAPDDVRRSGARGAFETAPAETDAQAAARGRQLVETATRPVVDGARTRGWRRLVTVSFLHQGWLAAWLVVVEVAVLLAVAGAGLAAGALLGLAAIATCLAWPARSPDQRAASLVATAGVALAVLVVHTVGRHDALFGTSVLGALVIGAALLGVASSRSLESLRAQHAQAQRTRQRAEQRLRCARIRAEDFLASVDDFHFETDAALRVRFVGPALRAMTGLTPKLLLGATPVEVAERHFGRYGRFGSCEARMRERRAIVGLRIAWYDRRGRRRRAVLHAHPRYDHAGHFLGYRGVVVEPPAGAP